MSKANNNLLNNTGTKVGVPALKNALTSMAIKKQIKSLLGEKAGHFMMAIVQVVEGTPQLQQADPQTIINAAIASATLNLPIEKNLGFSYIVPYKEGKSEIYKAQFQMGYKGYIQLALRTGQYKFINAIEVRKGELKRYNLLTGEYELEFIEDIDKRLDTEIIGYVSYIEFNNGFRNTLYMTKTQVDNHAKKYSQAYQYDINYKKNSSQWSKNFDAMALKTVLKLNLSKYGALSADVQKALQLDGVVVDTVDDDGTLHTTFIDNTKDENMIIAEEIEEKPTSEDMKTLMTIANNNDLDISKKAKELFGVVNLNNLDMKQYKKLKEWAITGD